MIAEINGSIVDTSVASFSMNGERNQLVDFTQGVFQNRIGLLIRTPSKHEISMNYFLLGKFAFKMAKIIVISILEFRIQK